ncbi:MAG: hypothetical protein QOF76_1155 [Solirubrobacteraceae bacterium]|jgi:hypothetical protein|nr:hypothetical protein [Solirubrobacteraceae bacterium]
MTVAITNIIAFLGGVVLIGGLLWAAKKGNGDREEEQAAREYFTLHGHWPDERP